MRRRIQTGVALIFVLSLVACGKNEAVRTVPAAFPPAPPTNPPTQAPAPSQNPGYYVPGPGGLPGYYPGGQPGGMFAPPGGGPFFQPQMPPGMSPQYYPFLPIDNYMRCCQPQLAAYWNQVWINWQDYAYNRGNDIYDFNAFWFDYCPQIWGGTPMADVYNVIDINYYDWVDPYTTTFSPNADPGYFWQYYIGIGY